MTIFVDAREEKIHNWTTAIRNIGVDAKVGNSLPADFLWRAPLGLILVERKTWADFCSSVSSGSGTDGGSRLVGQLIEGPKAAALSVLLLEGPLPPYVNSGGRVWSSSQMDDAAMSLQWQFGCVLIHSTGHAQTAERMAAFYRYSQSDEHRSLVRPVPPTPIEPIYMNPEFRKKIASMMAVPMLGEKGALTLPENTETPAEAINMSEEELLKLPGFGKRRAESFRKFWHSKW